MFFSTIMGVAKKGGSMKHNIVLACDFEGEDLDRIKHMVDRHTIQDQLDDQTEIILGWNDDLVKDLEEGVPPSLKWIQSHTAGVDTFPMASLEKAGVCLTNAKGIHKEVIAETVFGMVLAYQRQVLYAATHQSADQLSHPTSVPEVGGMTVAIVGTGSIGQYLGQVAKFFGMHTLGVNRSGRQVDQMDEIYTVDRIADALGRADLVINILPYTQETRYFYDLALFQTMKKGSLFINVGRGESVVEADLLQAIDQGYIAFAGLDVFDQDPLPVDHAFWTHDQVLVLPHIAGSRAHYFKHVLDIFEENYQTFCQGAKPELNLIDLGKGN